MNAYYTNTNTRRYTQSSSDAIRKAYISRTRKQTVANLIASLSESIDSAALRAIIFALKVISGIVCAISFFAVVGMIETGSISAFSGILCTVVISVLECLCFIPTAPKRSNSHK